MSAPRQKKAKATQSSDASPKASHVLLALREELQARYKGWTEQDVQWFLDSVSRRAEGLLCAPPAEGPEPVEVAKENKETDRE